MSDDGLSLNRLDLRDLRTREGRILAHGEKQSSGRSYLLPEGTDACVHYICYAPEFESVSRMATRRWRSMTWAIQRAILHFVR